MVPARNTKIVQFDLKLYDKHSDYLICFALWQPQHRWHVQQPWQQRQLLEFYCQRRFQRMEPQPELQQRQREPQQQQQGERLCSSLREGLTF